MSAAFSVKNNFRTTPGTTVVTAVGTGAVMDPAFPGANAITPDPSQEARWTYTNVAGTTYLQVDNATVMPLTNVVAALNVRADPAQVSQITIGLYSTVATLLEQFAFPIAQCDPLPGTTDRFDLFGITSVPRTTARYMRVSVTSGAVAGYAGVGHVWAGPGLVLPDGVDADWDFEPIDESEVSRGRSGSFAANVLPRRKRLVGKVSVQDYDTAMGQKLNTAALNFRKMFMEAGVSAPVVAVLRNDDAHSAQALGVYGLIDRVQKISHGGGNLFGTSYSVNQIR